MAHDPRTSDLTTGPQFSQPLSGPSFDASVTPGRVTALRDEVASASASASAAREEAEAEAREAEAEAREAERRMVEMVETARRSAPRDLAALTEERDQLRDGPAVRRAEARLASIINKEFASGQAISRAENTAREIERRLVELRAEQESLQRRRTTIDEPWVGVAGLTRAGRDSADSARDYHNALFPDDQVEWGSPRYIASARRFENRMINTVLAEPDQEQNDPFTQDQFSYPVVTSDGTTRDYDSLSHQLRHEGPDGLRGVLTREPISKTVYPDWALIRHMALYRDTPVTEDEMTARGEAAFEHSMLNRDHLDLKGLGLKKKPKQSAKQKKRAQRLKKLMKATGMTLPQASHWLKVNGY